LSKLMCVIICTMILMINSTLNVKPFKKCNISKDSMLKP
jgi:hypothetical protein